ncbi:hypothetical protein AAMO2058_000868900 [Amorphochlora amoebiformis]|uniref:NECAP PHear domain-containing protein n=1 Tax=Amorphochlora amoebiformis TaxID=1561963 RepID=A0A7S0DDT9_9EUKA|mmetsp:Transcript_22969/g.36085  ORF Transcript_22969/g.36085 Transcript_22969/m.36085 type:complete len:276 (+) Transcript_22969:24-851(+)
MALESTLLRLDTCKVYKLPPLRGAKGHTAKEWNIPNPLKEVKLHVIGVEDDLYLRLITNEGKLFAQSVKIDGRKIAKGEKFLDYYLDKVTDSSRFFVLKIKHTKSKRVISIGIGFRDRSSPTSLNASIDDHLQQVRRQIAYEREKEEEKKNPKKKTEDDDEFFAEFAEFEGPSSTTKELQKKQKQQTLDIFNLEPPPAEGGSTQPEGKKKKKKTKKKKQDAAPQAVGGGGLGAFADAFDDNSGFSDFASGNTQASGGADSNWADDDWGDFASGNN